MIINKLVLDIDGVLNTGHILYSSRGKMYKVFGPHDKDGLNIIKNYLTDITFITADVTGWKITYARIVKDWKYDPSQLILVKEEDRMRWFEKNCDFETTAYMADGFNDSPILKRVKVGIAPASARIEAREAARYITPSKAGEGAVLDACLFLERIINGLEKI